MTSKNKAMTGKHSVFVGVLGCAAISFPLLLAACGDDSSSNSSNNETAEDFMFTLEELEEMGVPIFESAGELKKEKCTDENEFETVYVKADSSFYMCYEGEWDNDFSGDNFTVEIPIVESKDDLGECNDENDGEMFRVPRETIFDTYACENGEWVSDFGGSSGKAVDPKTVVKGTFTDERDGKTYKTVKIGSQTWMAENLVYQTKGSSCFDGKIENCKKYGRLYNKNAVFGGACPEGWKVPTKKDWATLLATSLTYSPQKASGKGNYIQGVDFQSFMGLNNDPYGFNILSAGGFAALNSKFKKSSVAYFWTSTSYIGDIPYLIAFTSETSGYVGGVFGVVSLDFSIRCIKK